MKKIPFRLTPYQVQFLLVVGFVTLGYALYLRYLAVEFSTVSLVNTKFHHYILPALPALAILAGLFLDDFLKAPSKGQLWSMALVAVPLTFLSGRDLSAFPPRLLWEFNYDYVNAPGTGRPSSI